MKYEILLLGKTKKTFLVDGIDEYVWRLKHYADVALKTIKVNRIQGNDEVVKEKEADLLLGNLFPGTFIVALDMKGHQYTSRQFSSLISGWEFTGVRHVSFVIGGPLGLSEKVLRQAKLKFSLSKMTFTHDMARLLLLEQLYRAYTIKAGEKYHK
ncbi:MAG: 23S rRNA (pseudouridine(1915)-N(3))-methyltransferase RlmH [Desulfopila sp.]|jgi:23S rRNA (pseudouridine1915-N3)-methyltransferase|nr:23S rRNA (pseudouridine(1915)-N(3))-methyltransferase RlmH [Desulfopila sp.]